MSFFYHPQYDGSTERVNQCLEQFLRSMTCQNPRYWASWLTCSKVVDITTLNSIPYQVLYGIKPRHLAWSSWLHTNLQSVESMLAEWQQQWEVLKELLEATQRTYNNKFKREFTVRDWVYLKLQPYRQTTIALRKNMAIS